MLYEGDYAIVRNLPHIRKRLRGLRVRILRWLPCDQYLVTVFGEEYVFQKDELEKDI